MVLEGTKVWTTVESLSIDDPDLSFSLQGWLEALAKLAWPQFQFDSMYVSIR